jgi:hypothetical protein
MAQTPEQRREAAKRSRLMVLYRITPEEDAAVQHYQSIAAPYNTLLERGNLEDDSPANLYLDHRHTDGLVRGKLAYLINKALGTIENSYKERTSTVLRALAYYLDNPPATLALGSPRYGMIGRAKINKKKKVYGSPEGPIAAPKKVRNKK